MSCTAKGWFGLSRDQVKQVLRSPRLAVDETELFKAVLSWGRANLQKMQIERKEQKLLKKVLRDSLQPQPTPALDRGVEKAIQASLKQKEVGCVVLVHFQTDAAPSQKQTQHNQMSMHLFLCRGVVRCV